MDFNEIAIPAGVMDKHIVAAIKTTYPKYDKSLHSKVKRGDRYGIKLRPEAIEVVCALLGVNAPAPATPAPQASTSAARKKKPDRRSLPCRIGCRLSQRESEQLQQLIRSEGYTTMQDWLLYQIQRYINERNNQND